MRSNSALPYLIIAQSDYQRMPWKNGLGETLEIQRYEDNDGLRFRISQASVVEDGGFSDFSGLDRCLVLLSGHGMTLRHKSAQADKTEHHLNSPLDIARFAGGDMTHAELVKGPIEDLNIMVRETDTAAEVMACFAPHTITIMSGNNSLLKAFYANRPCKIRRHKAEIWELATNNVLLIQQNHPLYLIEGCGAFINITAK